MFTGREDKTAASVLSAASQRLQTAYFGLEDMKHPDRVVSGLCNAVIFGRTVTFALQNLRGICPDFESWYEPKVLEMKSDPLMKYFSDLRTTIEKTTDEYVLQYQQVSFSGSIQKMLGDPPPGAVGSFIGDRFGRSGWRVLADDGYIVDYYVTMPAGVVRSFTKLPNAPEPYQQMTATKLVGIYLDKLAQLVREAHDRFTTPEQ